MPRDDSTSPLPKPPRFTWPPRPIAPSEHGTPHVPIPAEVVTARDLSRRWPDALLDLLDDTRRIWFDLTLPRLEERFADAHFTPDPPSAYCHKCGLTAQHALSPDGCEDCLSRRPTWERIVRLGTYTQPLSPVIRQIKFTRWRRLGRDLGLIMGRQLAPQLPTPRPPIVLIPVPMSWRHRIVRGMDHTHALCRGVRSALGPRANTRILHLLRRSHGPSQVQALPGERAHNVGNRIQPKKFGFQSVPADAIVVVVDDVMTTGATMRASCRAAAAGLAAARAPGAGPRAQIWALVAARTELGDDDLADSPGLP